MDLLAYTFDHASVSVICKDNRVAEIRKLLRLFGVHSDEIKHIPHLLKKHIEVEFHVATDDHTVGSSGEIVDLFHRDSVDFVVAIEARDILSVSFDDIDQIINSAVIMDENFSIVKLIFSEDIFDCSLI